MMIYMTTTTNTDSLTADLDALARIDTISLYMIDAISTRTAGDMLLQAQSLFLSVTDDSPVDAAIQTAYAAVLDAYDAAIVSIKALASLSDSDFAAHVAGR